MLPITRVVLFKHGTAHFERSGNVNDNESIELSFTADQMNDVLKSLTTLDFGDGHFAALSYDSESSIDRRMAELSINIPPKAAITGFVDQMKGVEVSVETSKGAEIITGCIVGVEEMNVTSGLTQAISGSNQSAYVAILTDNSGLRTIAFDDIATLDFTDESIKAELNRLMKTQKNRIQSGKKNVTVQAVGQGTREISIAYVIEAPVWKTSYRLVFLKNADQTEKALLQGWAMVDNNSDEDWKNIELSLVSGSPISFTHDLYTSRYQARPDIKVKNESVITPPIVESSIAEEFLDECVQPFEQSVSNPFDHSLEQNELDPFDTIPISMASSSAPTTNCLSNLRTSHDYSQAIQTPIANDVSHTELGDLFSYNVDQAVSINRGQSALVPFLQTNVEANRVLYFNQSVRAVNAMSAIFINNSSNLTLEGGPLTVFTENNYVGEAMLETLKANDEKIVPYAIDLGVKIHQSSDISDQKLTKVSHEGQYLHKHTRREKIIYYKINSTLEQDMTLYLDHAFEYGPAFENKSQRPIELVEISENYWRYKIELKANEPTIFEVREAIQSQDSIYVPNIAIEEINSLNALKLISENVSVALHEIAELSLKKQYVTQEKACKTTQLDSIFKDQERLRQNMSSLGESIEENELKARYIFKLSQDEDTIEELFESTRELETQLTMLDTDINIAIDNL